MKKVLVIGAGLVARPHVNYLLNNGFQVILADLIKQKAEVILENHPHGEAISYDLTQDQNRSQLIDLLTNVDLAVSLLPFYFDPIVAEACVESKTHFIATNYVNEAINTLDSDARTANVILLDECGLDPGLDHMMAQRIIDKVHNEDGKIVKYNSYCGGLPTYAEVNPFGYKLSWSPRGFLLSGNKSAIYLQAGKKVVVPGEELFSRYSHVVIEGKEYEAFPNDDSLHYQNLYGIPEVQELIRWTLRYKGHCHRFSKIHEIGLLNDDKRPLQDQTFKQLIAELVGTPNIINLHDQVAKFLNLPTNHPILTDFEWLGLFDDRPIPLMTGSPLDVLELLTKEKLSYKAEEKDLVILQNIFEVEKETGKKEKIISTLIECGLPQGDSAMARTVGITSAIAVRMILEEKIPIKEFLGVQIPNKKPLYEPVLSELANYGIKIKETTIQL